MRALKQYSTLILIIAVLFSCKEKPAPAPEPFADFLVSNSGCISPCWVYFYDNSLNAISWEWDFGNAFNSYSQNDSMLYTAFGFYDVKLIIKNSDGIADSITKEVMVY